MGKYRNVYSAMRLVLSKDCELTTTERVVLIALLLHVGRDGTCWPSVSRLMVMTKLSRRAVQRALHSVAARPERCPVRLTAEQRDKAPSGPRSTLYTLEWPESEGSRAAVPKDDGTTQGGATVPSRGASHSPETASQWRSNDSGSAYKNDNTERSSGAQVGEGEKDTGSAEDLVLQAYAESFRSARGEDPPSGNEERRAARRVLAATQGNVERACKLVRNAYEDPFWARQSTLISIARDPARFMGEVGHARNPRDEPRVQRGIEYEPETNPEFLRALEENVNGDKF